MHQRQRPRLKLGEAADRRAHARVEGGILEHVLRRDRRPDNIAIDRLGVVAELGEKIAAQKGSGQLLVNYARIPAVRGVRRVEEADTLAAAEFDDLAVLELARRAIRVIVE